MPHDGHYFTEPPDDLTLRVEAVECLLAESELIGPADLT